MVYSMTGTIWENSQNFFKKRVQEGTLDILWAAIFCRGKIYFVRIDGKVDSEYYVNVLQNSLHSIVDALYRDVWTFQKDDPSVNTPNVTAQFLES